MIRFLQDIGAGNVHRHQVGSELDAAKVQRHRFGQLAYQQRFGQSGYPHQQRVTACKKTDDQLFDRILLTHDHTSQLGSQLLADFGESIDCIDIIVIQSIGRHGAL